MVMAFIFSAAVLQIHPRRVDEMLSRFSIGINDFQLLKKLPHGIVDFEAKFLPNVNVILIPGGQISQHRVDASRQGHQITGIGGHDLINTPAEVIEAYVHVQC